MGKLLQPFAEMKGDELALADELGETSWRALNERSNRLIHALRAAGLCSGDSLAILSGNRREYFEVMAAATHAGWRYVPVNWHWVGDEVAYVLDNSEARALVVDPRFIDVARDALEQRREAPHLLSLAFGGSAPAEFTDYEELLARSSPEEPEEQSAGGPMFYTSGTTGRPKGVLSAAAGASAPVEILLLMGRALSAWIQLPENGRTLLEGPVYHSAQWAFSFLPLVVGSSVVMRHKFDSAETLELIDRYRITNVHLVPTQFIRMLRLDESERASFSGSSLEIVWHGAAPCPEDVKRRMLEWWGPKIWEYYGSTEGNITSTIGPEEWLERPKSVGKPLGFVEVSVVKQDGSLAAPGEEGQIFMQSKLGSDFSYHKDSEKTDAAHLAPGLFTVGDMGYLDEDGYLYMSDRKIDMIISGGVNIYPAEIEGVIGRHAAVSDVAVFGVPNDEFGEEVKAVVELREGFAAGAELAQEIVTHCREHLAGYKVPRSVDFAEKLPRQPTGKLQKRLLREPYWANAGRSI